MTLRSKLTEHQRLELICEALRYCQRVQQMGMTQAAWTKALREPIFFLWECRNGSKMAAARYRSVAAAGLTWGRSEIVYDHAVPYAYLQNALMALEDPNPERVCDVFDRKLISCIITREEDTMLTRAGLRSKMPPEWDGADLFARYTHVGISVEANPHFVTDEVNAQ